MKRMFEKVRKFIIPKEMVLNDGTVFETVNDMKSTFGLMR